MKCCGCNKDLNVEDKSVPPTWYGQFNAKGLVKVICPACIQDETKRKKYEGEKNE